MASSLKCASTKHKINDLGLSMPVSKKVRVSCESDISVENVETVSIGVDSGLESCSEPMDVSRLLALGEGTGSDSVCIKQESDSEVSDLEEVDSTGIELKEPIIPKEGVNITLEAPVTSWKRKKKEVDIECEVRRHLNRRQREIQELMHKVHLLCCIHHLQWVNKVLNSESLLALSVSCCTKSVYPPKRADIEYIERLLKWFKKSFTLSNSNSQYASNTENLEEKLCYEIMERNLNCNNHFIYAFICILRSLGLQARLVVSFVVVPLKPSSKAAAIGNSKNVLTLTSSSKPVKEKSKSKIKEETKVEQKASSIEGNEPTKSTAKTKQSKSILPLKGKNKILKSASVVDNKSAVARRSGRPRNLKNLAEAESDETEEEEEELSRGTSKRLKKNSSAGTKEGNLKTSKELNNLQKGMSTSSAQAPKTATGDQKRITRSARNNDKDLEEESKYFKDMSRNKKECHAPKTSKYFNSAKQNKIEISPKISQKATKAGRKSESGVNKKDEFLERASSSRALTRTDVSTKSGVLQSKSVHVNPKTATPVGSKRVAKNPVGKIKVEEVDSDDDFSPPRRKSTGKKKLDRRVLSSDEEPICFKRGQDVWIEVFLEALEKWITVDVLNDKIHCVQKLYSRATQPVVYVLGANNNGTLKDVTQRYVPRWHSDTRKRRVAENWWKDTMSFYLPRPSAREREEDEDIAKQLEDMPLPTSISEYKSHPLYALKRHILKFEGIYPPDAPPLGFIRSEPVYARECVVTLRSRDIWFKEARIVRANEEPYKIVKSRPKYDKMTGEWRKDMPLDLFGVWQTDEYIPPNAVDGKVPRNEYGNVDLFKPCMLPGGTVHLQIPGLFRVAKKLDIDCAPAVTGFDFHSGACHPVLDGFVVCEEFKDVLVDAWNKDVEESAKRAQERMEKRVYGNWRRLIRGLLIRENLKLKYAFGEEDVEENEDEPKPSTSNKKGKSVSKKK